MNGRRRVIVVGGGITGLTAAVTLADDPTVVVSLREGADRLGGKLRTSPFAGHGGIDEGADAFLARVPHAVDLAADLGVALTAPRALAAAIYHRRLHRLPAETVLGVPASPVALARSRLLSPRGIARAAIEPLLPRRPDGDSIGTLIRQRFGDEVHERLVDALVGSIYGADTDRFSLAMVPQLAALAERHRSLLVAARQVRRAASRGPSAGPAFYTPRGGMAELAAAAERRLADRGVPVTVGAPVGAIAADGDGWRVDDESADVVIVASPAQATAPLLRCARPDLAALLGDTATSDVAIVTAAVADWPQRLAGLSGYLVAKPAQRTVTAASFGGQKWPHWSLDAAHADEMVLRVSLGRDGLPIADLDDEALVAATVTEVGQHLGVDLQPTATRVSRWPAAFTQYRPGHRRWLQAVDAATPPGIVLAGASYRGIGVPACIADGRRAAALAMAQRG